METNQTLEEGRIIEAVEEIIVVEDREGRVEEVIVEDIIVEKREPERGLLIFVNRVPKTERDGVKRHMTGAEIATLAGVPLDKAVVKQEKPDGKVEIGLGETIEIHCDEHFLVTRDKVVGGHE